MAKTDFLQRLTESVLVCDGAMGTMLFSQGIFINRCFDELNTTLPERVLNIHKAYVQAHADILETNTFGANRIKLMAHGLENQVHIINQKGAELGRQAAENLLYVAGSMGPLGVPLAPLGQLKPEVALAAFREQAEGLADGGVDLFIIETSRDLQEALIAIKAVRSISTLPILLINNKVIVELKAVDALNDTHLAQMLTYLKLSKMKLGFLINFNTKFVKDGIKRVANNL